MMRRIAIVGSGPAGFFLADALSKSGSVGVDLFERLTCPYGLVRYGVAPDHPATKEVMRIFDRVATRDNVRFYGGVNIGADITVADLCDVYEIVVIATGADSGRLAQFPGAEVRPDNVTAFDLMRAVNGHPNAAGLRLPNDVRSVAIIGAGNVAIDVARVLCREPERLRKWNTATGFLNWLEQQKIRWVDILCRCAPEGARFAPAMYDELVRVSSERNGTLVRFRYNTVPSAYDRRTLSIRTAHGIDSFIPADLVIHAIGQRAGAIPGLPVDAVSGAVQHREGWVVGDDSVFVQGWAAGALGTAIPDCRVAAKRVAPEILARLDRGTGILCGFDTAAILNRIGRVPINWEDWSRADAVGQRADRNLGTVR
ncbi:FAD-dependent oxidoreductase [Limibacillus halophilus]|uniref:NADPH-dependent glutamate synthase beta subunit-like oxidoreductase n=1 Tax=Limibacillus halophilus TaxID=1579333 RepID=A0A839SZD8_9PROT|nr:FAD-dependent oxidoreductase [Limibacillus halophilus]MBB3066986.1 NADPH-dependent glutamate synthase beta subunit-like oxidoreductase [Limibacillus halophilus]